MCWPRSASSISHRSRPSFWACFDNIDVDPGQAAVDEAQRRIDAFTNRHATASPAAVRCLEDDRQALTSFLRFPTEHHKRIRHTNLIERTFGETRRRVKVIGRLPGEASCLALVWAVLDRASKGWRGLRYTPAITRQLANIRHQLRPTTINENPTTLAAVTAAAQSHQQEPTPRPELHQTWDATLSS